MTMHGVSPSAWGSNLAVLIDHEEKRMNDVTLIRFVAGALAVVVFVILLFRMKKKAPR
jgi:hypothetical protein